MNDLMSDIISVYNSNVARMHHHVLFKILIKIDIKLMFLHTIRIKMNILCALNYFILYSSKDSKNILKLCQRYVPHHPMQRSTLFPHKQYRNIESYNVFRK